MRAIGYISIGAVAVLALAVASRASAATPAPSKPAPTPKPTPTPTPAATPAGEAPPITGLPPEVAKLIKDARDSDDPQVIRDAAYQLADKYPLQAADLLALATILEQPPDVK